MKKYIFIVSSILLSGVAYGQVELQSAPNVDGISNEAPFLDASGYTGADMGVGKGLLFPRTDLTTFEFKTDKLGGFQFFSTAFDGMIVYNTKSGKTGNNPATQGIQVDVEPGFYYFSHPVGDESSTDVSAGKWVRIGSGAANTSKVVLATNGTAVETNTVLGNSTVMAVKNTVTHTGGNSITIDKPADFNKLYSIKIYKTDGVATTLVGTNLYSYSNEGADKLKLVFGNGIISTSYPSGTYEYVLEYLKN